MLEVVAGEVIPGIDLVAAQIQLSAPQIVRAFARALAHHARDLAGDPERSEEQDQRNDDSAEVAHRFSPLLGEWEDPRSEFASLANPRTRLTETFRGAFLGVDPGQVEAARALGISNFQTFVYVRVPQMWRLALPNFGNHMLSLMKDTALISVIGLEEIVFVAEMATTVTLKPFTMYFIVAVIYLAISTVITLTVAGLEKYANRHLESGR